MERKIGLTDAKIAGIKPPEAGQFEIPDQIVPGLRLRVGPSGCKTYILRKRIGPKSHNVTLGRHSQSFGLAAARRKARDFITDIEQGRSIAKAKEKVRVRSKGVGTISQLFETYLVTEVVGKKRSAREIERVFRKYIIPHIGDRIADTVTRGDVSRFIEKMAFERGRETLCQARSIFQQLSSFYTWAMPKLDALPAHPCRDAWRPKAPKARERVLTDYEVALLWAAAEAEGFPYGTVVQLLMLTAQRRGEVLDADWNEFDLKNKIWTIPSDRAKNGVASIVPLSDISLNIINVLNEKYESISGLGDLVSTRVFPAEGNPSNSTGGLPKGWRRIYARVLEKADRPVPHFTPHDIRRTVATGLQRMGVPLTVSEAVLNHQSGAAKSGVAGVYHRHHYTDEKREALRMWSEELDRIVKLQTQSQMQTQNWMRNVNSNTR